jgi:hypothetical protein
VTPTILSIDPGMAGALALVDHNGELLGIEDMPIVKKEVDQVLLWNIMKTMRPTAVVIEYQQAMPPQMRERTQGSASTFKTGKNYGMLLGLAAALEVPFTTRRPSDWKKRMGLSKDKEESRALALRTWPGHHELFKFKKYEGRAEAALLGLSMLVEQGRNKDMQINRVPAPTPRKKLIRLPG